jgi:hypothetical protein
MPDSRILWGVSIGVSLLLTVALFFSWHARSSQLRLPGNQLTDPATVEQHVADYSGTIGLGGGDAVIGIPTGVFIQSMDFRDSTRVYVAGHLWMHFPPQLPAAYEPWTSSCDAQELPFIFADQVDTASDITPQLRYQATSDYGNLCGWYFEVTLRERFAYRQYPFDRKTVSLRLWTRSLLSEVLLVPDLAAYPQGTGPADLFGIDTQRIVLSSWSITNTYFNYTQTAFDTTFGIMDTDLLSTSLELNYNFVLKRSLVDSMVEHLLGVLVVLILLFATMLVGSRDPDKAERHGFNTSMVLGACSALFFVILISHIQIRSQFSGTTIVYLETFYYLTYALLIGTTVNTYYFAEEPNRVTAILHYRDNLVPKLLYWPIVLTYSVLVSRIMLF